MYVVQVQVLGLTNNYKEMQMIAAQSAAGRSPRAGGESEEGDLRRKRQLHHPWTRARIRSH